MPKIFDDFAEIEQEVKSKVPAVTYKYRDWASSYHRTILTENSIWFAHPKDLNDPYDIRVPVTFDFSEVDHTAFFERLKYHTALKFPHIDPSSREFQVIAENKFDLIKADPKSHFESNYMQIREGDLYDRVGVFSLTEDCLNETMWAHYGNNGQGFCVGFDTVGLVKATNIAFGFVEYQEKPPLHSFIVSMEINNRNEMFMKHSKWGYEMEFRLVTLRISSDKDRAITFDPSLIKEVVLGGKIPIEHKQEIIKLLQSSFKGTVKLFEVVANASSYGFSKKQIKYV